MKNGISNNKTFFVLTILFCLILNGIRAGNNDEIKSLVQCEYSSSSISYVFNEVINKLPTLRNKIFGVEYLYKLMRENKDVKDTEKIFEYARHYNDFLKKNWREIKASDNLRVNVILPECVETVVIEPKILCFDNGNYILKTYNNPYTSTKYYLYEGNCKHQSRLGHNFLWEINNTNKQRNSHNLQSMDKLARQFNNVKFELAPDGERCYIKVNGQYLTKDGRSQYLTFKYNKSPNGIWYVRTRLLRQFQPM